MTSIAHIIHPVVVPGDSDLFIAQPITFETMRAAAQFARPVVEVSIFAIQYHDEARIPLPEMFQRVPDLRRSVSDVKSFNKKRKLAILKDILDQLIASSAADYMIYTNVDIAVQPYFYTLVDAIIRQGYDAFAINRRTISKKYQSIDQSPLMYSEVGEKHMGWDCFIFHRDLYPHFQLGQVCIGTGWIGRTMLTNMSCLAKQFKVFEDLHSTFHIGDDRVWRNDEFSDYLEHNRLECAKILLDYDRQYGPLNREEIPGMFIHLLDSKPVGFWRRLRRKLK